MLSRRMSAGRMSEASVLSLLPTAGLQGRNGSSKPNSSHAALDLTCWCLIRWTVAVPQPSARPILTMPTPCLSIDLIFAAVAAEISGRPNDLLGPGSGRAGLHSLPNNRVFKFGEHTKHLEHRLPTRRRTQRQPPVLTSPEPLSTLNDGSLARASLNYACRDHVPAFPQRTPPSL